MKIQKFMKITFLRIGSMEKENDLPIVQGRTFHFISEDVLRNKRVEKSDIVATIDVKYGAIKFSPDAFKQLSLEVNRLKFYVDTGSRVIGFKLKNHFDSFESMKSWRLITLKNSVAKTTIFPLIKELQKQGTLLNSYKGIKIKKWKDKNSVLDGEDYYYLDLRAYEREKNREGIDG